VPRGRVFKQQPAAGQEVATSTYVAVWYSNGPHPPAPALTVLVPSVITLSREAARRQLKSVGLGVGRLTQVVLTDRSAGILFQTPRAGAAVGSGTLVDLVENRPPEVRRVRVPDLSGKSVAASENALRRDSLVLGDVLRPGVNAIDRVIDQRPPPGQMVFMHSAVTIALGVGAGQPSERVIRLPNVVNLSVDSARRTLNDSGFARVSIGGGGDRRPSSSIVESQTPAAGTFVTPGTIVSIVPRAAAPSLSLLEAELEKLRPAKVAFDSPDTLFVDQPAKVSVVITPKSSSASPDADNEPAVPAPTGIADGNREPVVPDTTRISEVTQVCLTAPGFRVQNEAGEEKGCRDQPVSVRRPSIWSWILTALPQIQVSGRRPITLTVNAILPGYPPYTVSTTTHQTFVQVSQPSMMKRLQAFLDEWKALMVTTAGMVAVLLPLVKWLRSRKSGDTITH
jgi:beta-lactam-binding protein with PASTA domain